MAESLLYLTYLKRRITFAEESVGGPVDVAIISKVMALSGLNENITLNLN